MVNLRYQDYAFYYDFVNQKLYTIRPFNELYADTTKLEQIPIQHYNFFDEFGARVGLQRLYLESNLNFKGRILDVYRNPPSVDINGLKLTLRRELDIWRAYGATPDSNYLGATPEIIEIFDIQNSADYFDIENNPKNVFRKFVDDLNYRFPSNIGYVKWDQAYWDYAGKYQEGVSSVPQTTDAAKLSEDNIQSGIGDFDDAKLILEKLDEDIDRFFFGIKLNILKSTTTEKVYEPINIAYDSYISYTEKYIDNQYATINYDLYLDLAPYGDIATPSTYKVNITEKVRNNYDSTYASSPEYITRDIFNASLLTDGSLDFRNKYNEPYRNVVHPSATETYTLTNIPLNSVDSATVNFVYAKNAVGQSGDYGWISFAEASPPSTPSGYITSTNTHAHKLTPRSSGAQTRLRIGSKLYDAAKTRSVDSPKVRSSAYGNTLNDSNYYQDTNNVTLNVPQIIRNIVLPYQATPNTVHIENVVVSSYQNDLTSVPNIGRGGVSLNREDGFNYLIPSSPNIQTQYVVSGSTVNGYFTDLSIPFNATPNYINVSAATSSYYPFTYKVWEKATADYVGLLDFFLSKDGIVQSTPDQNYDVLQNKSNDLIGVYTFERSDFGLASYASSDDITVESIEIVNSNNLVDIWQETSYDEIGNQNLNYFNPDTDKYQIKDINFKAAYSNEVNKYMNPSIRTGWYYQGSTPRYIYAEQNTDYAQFDSATPTKFINLTKIATTGAPISLTIADEEGNATQYTRVSFFDEATPSELSYYNYEYITASYSNSIMLAYSNVFDVSIVDTVTGETVLSGASSETNQILIISIPEEVPLQIGREYRVQYRVHNTYNVDNQYYDELFDEYKTKVTLLSTPSYDFSATVSYETSIYNKDKTLNDLILNPLYAAQDNGYIYLSHDVYESHDVELILSPKEIINDGIDYISLNIFSKDINGNPKPYQTFHIHGDLISANPEYVTTDSDGFAVTKITCEIQDTNKVSISNINVDGLSYPTTHAHVNSSSNGINSSVNFYIKPYIDKSMLGRLTADLDKKIITADGNEKINIYGKTTANKKVYWRKARNLHAALNLGYSTSSATPGQSVLAGTVLSNDLGTFEIGPFVSQPDATPGYWFVVVDSELSSTPSSSPVTIAGDIVYWYEKYDANRSNSTDLNYIPSVNHSSDYSSYLEDALFKIDYKTNDIILDEDFELGWTLPKWYPIKRYTQYLLGLLGSTPNIISDYRNIHPDYEEE